MGKKVIGIDYGSDSARAVLVDVSDGKILSTCAAVYPRWSKVCIVTLRRHRSVSTLWTMSRC